jgi:hypothetical protein
MKKLQPPRRGVRRLARAQAPYREEPEGEREKISITVDRDALKAIRKKTENVSAFYDDAAKERLYALRLDEELARLEAEGVPLDRTGYDWVLGKIEEAYVRRERR